MEEVEEVGLFAAEGGGGVEVDIPLPAGEVGVGVQAEGAEVVGGAQSVVGAFRHSPEVGAHNPVLRGDAGRRTGCADADGGVFPFAWPAGKNEGEGEDIGFGFLPKRVWDGAAGEEKLQQAAIEERRDPGDGADEHVHTDHGWRRVVDGWARIGCGEGSYLGGHGIVVGGEAGVVFGGESLEEGDAPVEGMVCTEVGLEGPAEEEFVEGEDRVSRGEAVQEGRACHCVTIMRFRGSNLTHLRSSRAHEFVGTTL